MMSSMAAMSNQVGQGVMTASTVNSLRIGMLTSRMTHLFRSGARSDTANSDLFHICIHLAKGIDYAVIHNEVPSSVRDLPPLIKQVYQRKTDAALQSAIMLLMISVKNACRNGWFQATDSDELLTLTNEISNSFCAATIAAVETSNAFQMISKIISRFYPRMKMGHIIVSFEAKPGYEVLVSDFLIHKSMPATTARERICLFVAQTDNIETSSCIITPPEVNFMLNGKGVERRTNVSTDVGPQFPTDVTAMLKYGTNLIQVIGKFSGNYVIVIAYESVVSSSNTGSLQDYVQPAVAVAELVSDAEIIEGPSRISLNCPISFMGINTPVKGHLCRHHQCFDYDNFLEINSRKPSWRCPHCNQSVCFTDLRIDQNMVKVLKEVGEDVADVLISADGSWKVIDEHADLTNQLHNGSITGQLDGLEQTDSKRSQNAITNVVDLTMQGSDDEDDVAINSTGAEALMGFTNQRYINNIICESEDRKPFQDIQPFSATGNLFEAPAFNSTSEMVQEPAGQNGQNVWSRISSLVSAVNGSVSHSTAAAATARIDAPVAISESFTLDTLLAPVLTDAVSPALNRGPSDGRGATQLTTTLQNVPQLRQFVAPENLQLRQPRFENSIISNETLRRSIPRHISRTPIAVQALPAQTQAPNMHHQRTWPNVMDSNPIISNGSSSVASQISPYMAATPDGFASGEMERQQLSRSQISPLSASDFTSSSSQLHTMSQVRDPQYAPNQLMQQVVGLPGTSQVGTRMPSDQQRVSAYRASSGLLPPDQNPYNWRPQNLRVSETFSRAENLVQQSSRYHPSRHVQQPAQGVIGLAAGSLLSQHTRPMVPQHSLAQMTRPPGVAASRRVPSYTMNANDIRQSFGDQRWNPVVDSLTEFPSDENWRQSTARMRGSLTGPSYYEALSQLMAQPTPSEQARPPVTAQTSVSPVQLQVIANSVNAHGQPQAYSRTGCR